MWRAPMNLIPTEKLPCRKANSEYKNLREYILAFIEMDVPYAKVEYSPEEFIHAQSAKVSFNRMIRMFNFPVLTTIVNGELYLVRLNLEE
jgi:hypothetical protein